MPTFDDMVMQTIDEVVRNVFDDEIAETIFQRSTRSGSGGVDNTVRAFADSLPKILGTGSVIIEDLILETLYSRLGLELERKKEYGFTEYVVELKKRTEKREK